MVKKEIILELCLNPVDTNYPFQYLMKDTIEDWEKSYTIKIKGSLLLAKKGDILFENELINYIGTIQRNRHGFEELNQELKHVIQEALEFLKSVGRSINLNHVDPAFWISTRSGQPRW